MPDVTQISDLIAKGGVIPLLVAIVVVLAREYRRLERRCDQWQWLAFKAGMDAEHGADLAEGFKEALR